MKRRRGFILMYGLAVLAIMLAAVLLLAQAAGSRHDIQREESARESALRGAESALEQARAALSDGRLKAGQSLMIDGLKVDCAAIGKGNGPDVRLETLAFCASPPAYVRRAVRVVWNLHPIGAGNEWKVTGWRTANETVTATVAVTK